MTTAPIRRLPPNVIVVPSLQGSVFGPGFLALSSFREVARRHDTWLWVDLPGVSREELIQLDIEHRREGQIQIKLRAEADQVVQNDQMTEAWPAITYEAESFVECLHYTAVSVYWDQTVERLHVHLQSDPERHSQLGFLRPHICTYRSVPSASVPSASVPSASVPSASVPSASVPSALPQLGALGPDAEDALWRVAGTQSVKLVRDPLAALMARGIDPDDPAFRGKVARFLQTDLGEVLLSSLFAVFVTECDGPAPLAREFRVRTLEKAGDSVVDLLSDPLRKVLCDFLRDAPPVASTTAATTPESPPPALPEPRQTIASNPEATRVKRQTAARGTRRSTR